MNDPPADARERLPDDPRRRIVVRGSHVRVSCRLRLEPVGQEWDGKFVPIDSLTYNPPPGGVTDAG